MQENNEIYFSENAKMQANLCYHIELNKTYEFMVESNYFSGRTTFCFHVDDLKKIIDKLNAMSMHLSGECVINDADSNNFLKVYFTEQRIKVEGLFGDFDEQSLKFAFYADQTILRLLSSFFSK